MTAYVRWWAFFWCLWNKSFFKLSIPDLSSSLLSGDWHQGAVMSPRRTAGVWGLGTRLPWLQTPWRSEWRLQSWIPSLPNTRWKQSAAFSKGRHKNGIDEFIRKRQHWIAWHNITANNILAFEPRGTLLLGSCNYSFYSLSSTCVSFFPRQWDDWWFKHRMMIRAQGGSL